MMSTSLADRRRAIRHLLNEREPVDALAAYYAFHHPDNRTSLYTMPSEAARARGYVAVSRTGIDLFRPLLTLRLPLEDPDGSVDLIYEAVPVGTAVLINSPNEYLPLLEAFFHVDAVQPLRLYVLDPSRYRPIVNVLVSRAESGNNLPRYIIRRSSPAGRQEVVASANLNWQSPNFAEIAVRTSAEHRRQGWGRSVVAALASDLLAGGRIPLYVTTENNQASRRLAESTGFRDSGARLSWLEATLRPRP